MSDTRYPTRMHEVLGVATEERFLVKGYTDRDFDYYLDENGHMRFGVNDMIADNWIYLSIVEGIIRKPRLTEEAQEKEDHIIRLERMRSQKDQWANGKHAHWLETPADHAKDRDALDAAIEALTGKPRLSEEGEGKS